MDKKSSMLFCWWTLVKMTLQKYCFKLPKVGSEEEKSLEDKILVNFFVYIRKQENPNLSLNVSSVLMMD